MSSSQFGYKVLNEDGTPFHGGKGRWHLPNGELPGLWMPEISPVPCRQGYHYCRNTKDLLNWLGPVIYQIEVAGKIINSDNKAVAEKARLIKKLNWNEKSARLFAADCAERQLKQIPLLSREPFINSIRSARDFANGLISQKKLNAAWDAARAAAWDATWSAAWSAAGDAARAAARAAAWDAAWSAAGAAARDAARDIEKQWQAKRLQVILEA